jgi:microcystin-dependent protein
MLAAVLFVFVALGRSQTVPAPDSLTVFKAGDTARASAVNANFKLLWTRLNALAAENQGLGKKLDSLKKASTGGGDSLGLPIGTIVPSTLPPAKFEAQFPAKTWLLADGSRTDAAEYAAAFGTDRLPDLRGVFLRGMNLGRSDNYSDPAGNRTAGSAQGDATSLPDSAFVLASAGSHSHAVDLETTATRNFEVAGSRVATNTVASPGVAGSPKPVLPSSGSHTHALSGGDAETRPKNVAVYYYIKVK